MHKDFKIGLGIGLLLVTAAVVWLCTSPELSTESRALQNASARTAVSPDVIGVERPAITPAPVTAITQPPVEIQPKLPQPLTSGNEQPTTKPLAKSRFGETNTEQNLRFHIVQKGDTLSGISQKYYGSSRQWLKILNANRNTLPDPNRLTPGLKLIIPE